VSATPGARAAFTFAGTSVQWIGSSGPQAGIARIFLDGALQATVDTYAPTEIQAAVFKVTGLAAARHRLEVEVTGQKNPAASNSLIVVDAFDIRPRVEDADPSITYSGAWTAQDTIRAYSGTSLQYGGGTAARSATAGARAQFRVHGHFSQLDRPPRALAGNGRRLRGRRLRRPRRSLFAE
jgi:bacillopeptidase F